MSGILDAFNAAVSTFMQSGETFHAFSKDLMLDTNTRYVLAQARDEAKHAYDDVLKAHDMLDNQLNEYERNQVIEDMIIVHELAGSLGLVFKPPRPH